jgi:enterochelin esterase-like enzyme
VADEIKLPEDTRPLVYRLYLPPCFDPGRAARYPTLYLMHGLAQSESEWIDLGIAATADRLIAQGSIPAMLIVMPGERTGYDMLVALTDTLLPHLERSLPSGGRPELRAIGGLSHGGGWALRIGFQHPELFGAIGLHSPAVISPDLYLLPSWAAEMPSESIPRLWIDIGSEDTLLPGALDLRARLDKLHWPYTWVQNPGEHTSTYWSGQLAEYLGWYAQAWPSRGPEE